MGLHVDVRFTVNKILSRFFSRLHTVDDCSKFRLLLFKHNFVLIYCDNDDDHKNCKFRGGFLDLSRKKARFLIRPVIVLNNILIID